MSDDVESPSSNRPPERTLSILRRVSAGMIKTLNADAFDQGAGPILELMEVWDQLVRLEEQVRSRDPGRLQKAVQISTHSCRFSG